MAFEPLEIRALLTGFPDVVIDGTAADDALVLETDPNDASMLRVRSANGSMPSVSFAKVGLNSLAIHGGGGRDSITVVESVALGGGELAFTAESIAVSAGTAISGAGEVSLIAVAENSVMATGTPAIASLNAQVLVEGNITTNGSLLIEARVDHAATLTGVGASFVSTSTATAQIASGALVSAGTLQILASTEADVTADAAGAILGSIEINVTATTRAAI